MIPCELFASISPYLICEGRDEIIWAFDRHSVEIVTLSKHVAEYEKIRKWMFEFLSKFQNRGIKIHRVN